MCLTEVLSSSFHNIVLSALLSLIFRFFQFRPIELQRPDGGLQFFFFFLTHPDKISFCCCLSLSGEIGQDSWIPFSFLCEWVLLHYCLFHRQLQMLKGEVSQHSKQPISSMYFILIGSVFLDWRKRDCCHNTAHWLIHYSLTATCKSIWDNSEDWLCISSLFAVWTTHTHANMSPQSTTHVWYQSKVWTHGWLWVVLYL